LESSRIGQLRRGIRHDNFVWQRSHPQREKGEQHGHHRVFQSSVGWPLHPPSSQHHHGQLRAHREQDLRSYNNYSLDLFNRVWRLKIWCKLVAKYCFLISKLKKISPENPFNSFNLTYSKNPLLISVKLHQIKVIKKNCSISVHIKILQLTYFFVKHISVICINLQCYF